MRRRAPALLAAVLGLAGCSTQAVFCTTVGCIGRIDISIDAEVADLVDAETSVRACLGSQCVEKSVLPGSGPIALAITSEDFEVDSADLVVEAVDADGTVFSAAIPLVGSRINGEDCSPVCYQESVVVTPESLDG